MAFGLPPKHEIKTDRGVVRQETLEKAALAHKNLKWELVESSEYLVQYYIKRRGLKALIYPVGGYDVSIRVTEKNEATITSSGPASGFTDGGKNKKNCELLAKELGIKI